MIVIKGGGFMNDHKIALIPAYKPDAGLLQLLKLLKETAFSIILVDDGSGEAYNDIFHAAAAYATLLSHPINQGKGAALKTGLTYIQTHYKHAVIVTMDADGQHTVPDAETIVKEAGNHNNTLILGSRKLKKTAPLRSRFGNAATRLVFRLTTGISVYDTQTGLRAFRMELLPFLLSVDGNRYEYEMNVLLLCAKQQIPIKEIEIETIYQNQNAASHFHPIQDSARIYWEILKFSAASFVSFLLDYLLYTLLSLLTASMPQSLLISNITARMVSAAVNYIINRKLVFQDKGNAARSAIQYILLAAGILLGNTLVLNALVGGLGCNRFAAKLLTELLFFLLSFLVQRFIIFKKEREAQ